MTDATELAQLVQRVTEAAQALIRGDIEGYLARIKHADDYTLMSPYGKEPKRGFVDSEQADAGLAQFFRGGTATWPCSSSSSGSGARWETCRSRTGRCG
jgi:hypothetical protein